MWQRARDGRPGTHGDDVPAAPRVTAPSSAGFEIIHDNKRCGCSDGGGGGCGAAVLVVVVVEVGGGGLLKEAVLRFATPSSWSLSAHHTLPIFRNTSFSSLSSHELLHHECIVGIARISCALSFLIISPETICAASNLFKDWNKKTFDFIIIGQKDTHGLRLYLN